MDRIVLLSLILAVSLPRTSVADTTPSEYPVGVAAVDVTPRYPIRLNGFGFRRSESEGVQQRIWVKALAIGEKNPALVLTIDNLGIPVRLVDALAKRLARSGVQRDRLAICATHTHTAPMLDGVTMTIFGTPIPKEHLEHVRRYTREFLDAMEKASLAALADRKPSRLNWGIGKVGFAINRRTAGGPVDHDLPVLVVKSREGKIRAIWANYACHAVTLSNNKVGGDWPGYAQQAIEDDHPGAVAMVSIGCGADSNPSSGVTGDKVEIASRQGMEIAREVKRMIGGYLAPVQGELIVVNKTIELPLADLPKREEWERRATRKDAVGHHARVTLERLNRGEKLATRIDYPITTWSFGDSLAMVFLPGEVVVDYALRLKKELDGQRVWINAYSNDAPCYVPSERILKEGGYEGGGAMVYYDVPAPFRPGLEKKIVETVREQLDKRFAPRFDSSKIDAPALSPQQSLLSLVTKKGLRAELVAAEPLVQSPVAIDFGPDGRLWVAEMFDYPSGLRGDFQPAGRISVLEDVDGDGIFDRSTIFLDKIPFPTGVTVWRDGVLVCAAPDILFARDTNGDGKADQVTKLFTGFGTDNYQARVNSLCYGLDGWVHGSCGLFGGKIVNRDGKVVALGDRDFRIRPDDAVIEPASGRTQQGRVRDDWGNWFGCDNSTFAVHHVLVDHYLRRNPHVSYPNPTHYVPDYPASNRIFPVQTLQLFKLSGPAGLATGACGIGVYRDDLLGADYVGNLFTCEPVNLVVHRLKLSPKGNTFAGRRADDERESEFLASTDRWFRPVQMRTGPDGAIWIVDVHRYVIEHPRWIPQEDLDRVDLRAGATMGRIYRIVPNDKPLRPTARLDRMGSKELVEALNTPNGTVRDLAAQMLLWRADKSVAPALARLTQSERAEVRLQALCVLEGLGKLSVDTIRRALHDRVSGVRRHAVRFAEKHLDQLGPDLLTLVKDPNAQVRGQLAYTLGEWQDARAAKALATLACTAASDPYLTAAVLSSVGAKNAGDVLAEVMKCKTSPTALTRQILAVIAGVGDEKEQLRILNQVAAQKHGFADLAAILDALERRGVTLPKVESVQKQIAEARKVVVDPSANLGVRLAALSLLGRDAQDLELLGGLFVPQNPPELHAAALRAISRRDDASVPGLLLQEWKSHSPSLRGQIIDLLSGRPGWLKGLLDALAKDVTIASQVDAGRRQHLLTHKDDQIRKQAALAFKHSANPNRQAVIKEYAAALSLSSEPARGKQVFEKHCATCHRLEGIGHEVGPDLAALANKTPLYLLGEILDPNRNLDTRYLQYLVTTNRGLTYTGLLASETTTNLTLRLQEGKTQSLLRSEIEELQSSGRSLMPEGLEKDLSKQNVADLLAYLTRQAKSPKSFAGNRPQTIHPIAGQFALPASAGEIHGNAIVFEEPFQNVGYWHGVEDHVVWTLAVGKGSTFDVWMEASCDGSSAGNSFVLDGGKPSLRGVVESTGGWQHYRLTKLGSVTLSEGTRRLTLRPEAPPRGALLDLRAMYLVPVGSKPDVTANRPKEPLDAPAIAKQILDESIPAARRQSLCSDHPKLSDQLLTEMTKNLQPGKEEYRRIPWIWRVAIAAGKRNDPAELKKVLAVSLPQSDEPLRDWQAVVLGGGVINGISLVGKWPDEALQAMLKDNVDLQKRWSRALDLSSKMADDPKVPTGTRYDALRMIALDSWEKRGDQLARYLARGTNDELMQGAVSGLSDVRSPKVAGLLIGGLPHFSAGNRSFAIEALLRTEQRVSSLLDAIESGKIAKSLLTVDQKKALLGLKNEKLRRRAEQILGK